MHLHEIDHPPEPARAAEGPNRHDGEQTAQRALAEHRTDVLDAGAVLHLQRTAGNAGVSDLMDQEEESPVKQVVGSGGGQPLEARTREDMEARLGADFSTVRVHTGAQASDSASSVQAHAYTVGENIVFQESRYQPGTPAGDRMLAHELTHVIQQRSGPVAGTEAPGGIRLSDPSDAFERAAEANAERAMAGPPPAVTTPTAATAPALVQRQEATPQEKGPEEVQGSFVQRQEVPEEEKEPEEPS